MDCPPSFDGEIAPPLCKGNSLCVGELTERRPLCGSRGALRIPRLPPDFLSSLVVSIDLMRLSLLKAAYVTVDECCVVGNPELAPNEQPSWGPKRR